jgi:MraZ protein
MPAFRGQYTYSLDTKGRLNVPARFRRQLEPEAEETFVVTSGFDHCLFVYPLDEWERKEATLRDQAITNSRARKVVRVLMANATESTCDRQGRILIPQNLIVWARLVKEVLINGALDRIEFWNPDVFAGYIGDIEETFEELAEDLIF